MDPNQQTEVKEGQPRKLRSRPRVEEVKKGDQGCKDSPRIVLEAERRGMGEGRKEREGEKGERREEEDNRARRMQNKVGEVG